MLNIVPSLPTGMIAAMVRAGLSERAEAQKHID
jgi:hypothetical protein